MTYTALVEAYKAKLAFDGLFLPPPREDAVYAAINASRWTEPQIRRAAVNQAACEWLAAR